MDKMTFTLEKLVCKPLSRLHNFLPNVLSKQVTRIRHTQINCSENCCHSNGGRAYLLSFGVINFSHIQQSVSFPYGTSGPLLG